MLFEMLRAGREPTAGLSHLSTPDSILMCYEIDSPFQGRDRMADTAVTFHIERIHAHFW